MNEPLPKSHAAELREPARLLIVAAAVLWSTSGFFVKSPQLAGWPGPALAFWRAGFACVVLWPLVRRPQWSWKLIPAAADVCGDELHVSDGDGEGLGRERDLAAMHGAGVGAARGRVCVSASGRCGATGCWSRSRRQAWR